MDGARREGRSVTGPLSSKLAVDTTCTYRCDLGSPRTVTGYVTQVQHMKQMMMLRPGKKRTLAMRVLRPGPSKVGNTTASRAPNRFVMSRVHTEDVACVGPCRMRKRRLDLG